MFKDQYEESSNVILDNSYVDEILFAVSSKFQAEKNVGEIDTILKAGGFPVKQWIMSGRQVKQSIVELHEEKILGIIWEPERDVFKFKAKLNFFPKVKGIYKDKDLTCDKVPSGIPHILTQRMVLSQVSSIYDSLRLLTPFVLQSNLLLRALCCKDASKENSWDEPLMKK